jgi:hypothetical protein
MWVNQFTFQSRSVRESARCLAKRTHSTREHILYKIPAPVRESACSLAIPSNHQAQREHILQENTFYIDIPAPVRDTPCCLASPSNYRAQTVSRPWRCRKLLSTPIADPRRKRGRGWVRVRVQYRVPPVKLWFVGRIMLRVLPWGHVPSPPPTYTHTHTHIHTHTYTHTHTYILYMYVCMWLCMCVCMYECMYVCMHACMHACMYVCNVHMYVYMYVCIHVCMYTCMYVYMYVRM